MKKNEKAIIKINHKKGLFFLISELIVVSFIIVLVPRVNKFATINGAYTYNSSIIPPTTDAAAFPKPVVPCLDTGYQGETGFRDPEFHSLRPYQASPCGDSPKAYFCNNDYNIEEDVSQKWDPNWCWYGNLDGSAATTGGSYFCEKQPNTSIPDETGRMVGSYIIGGPKGRDYGISLNGVKYPFLGFTQLNKDYGVLNSQQSLDNIDPAGKMNEYVDWYLQGSAQKAEYGWGNTVEKGKKANRNLDTYAGPNKKLLPFDILNFRRLKELHDAGVKPAQGVDPVEYQGRTDLLTPVPGKPGEYVTQQTFNHNQIVLCLKGGNPTPCYKGDGSKSQGTRLRLVQWWEARGSTPTQTFYNWNILNSWGGVTPPFPWQFSDSYLYQKAFQEWTGKSCFVWPGTTNYFCLYLPLFKEQSIGMKYYYFIPLGNSSDKNAKHLITGLQVRANGQTQAILLGYEITHEPVLHYPHTLSTVEESKDLDTINTPLVCEVPEGTPAPLPGQGGKCCPTGFTYTSAGADACINDNLNKACEGFQAAVCGALGSQISTVCSSNLLVQQCQAQVLNPTFAQDTATLTCTMIMSAIPVLGSLSAVWVPACVTAVNALKVVYQQYASQLSVEPTCPDGLKCSAVGICEQPVGQLNCSPITGLGTNYEPTSCIFTDVRTNFGDSLTFADPETYLLIENVMTRVDIIECENSGALDKFFSPVSAGGCGGQTWNKCETDKCNPLDCNGYCGPSLVPGSCTSYPDCKATVFVKIPTVPKIPYADQVWQNTVVNKTSSFRRIFPKITTKDNAPVSCIKEIPGYSAITYIPNDQTNLVSVDTAGPNTFGTTGNLYFPHLGTIYEYFLKGIQTALRPKGFGYGPLPNGNPVTCAATANTGPCKMWLFEPAKNGQKYYDYIIERATQTSCNGKTLNPYWAIFFALNEDAGLMTDNINGWGDAHFGCSINKTTGAEDNIEDKTSCMLNTIRNDCGKPDLTTLCEYGYKSACAGTYDDFGTLRVLTGGENPPLWGTNMNTGASLVSTLLSIDWTRYYPEAPKTFCPTNPTIQGPVPPSGK